MANILGIVTQQQETVDENKLRELCSRKKILGPFWIR